MDVFAYVRASTAKQRVERQVRELDREARRRSWTVVEVVEDPAQSAGTLERPKLLETLARLDRGKAEALVVCDLDRLTRDVVDMGDLLNWFDEAGVRLVSLAQQLDTGLPGARGIALAWASFAQIEREKGRTRPGWAWPTAVPPAPASAGRPWPTGPSSLSASSAWTRPA